MAVKSRGIAWVLGILCAIARPGQAARPITIVIDGPSGAGKGTAGKGVARRLGYRYVDTGVFYRSVTLQAMNRGVDLADGAALAALVRSLPIVFQSSRRRDRVLLGGEDVTSAIRAPQVTAKVAELAQHPQVRAAINERIRALAAGGGVVMDGRDLGTVVCPDAQLKCFLTADPAERARRHCQALRAQGKVVDLAEVAETLARKDQLDATREHAPLTQAPDAMLLDTTHLTPRQVVTRILREARRRMAAPALGTGPVCLGGGSLCAAGAGL